MLLKHYIPSRGNFLVILVTYALHLLQHIRPEKGDRSLATQDPWIHLVYKTWQLERQWYLWQITQIPTAMYKIARCNCNVAQITWHESRNRARARFSAPSYTPVCVPEHTRTDTHWQTHGQTPGDNGHHFNTNERVAGLTPYRLLTGTAGSPSQGPETRELEWIEGYCVSLV